LLDLFLFILINLKKNINKLFFKSIFHLFFMTLSKKKLKNNLFSKNLFLENNFFKKKIQKKVLLTCGKQVTIKREI